MSNKYLSRSDAPFGDELWEMIDQTMKSSATPQLGGRRILDLKGPFGFGLKTIPLGETQIEEGVTLPGVLPLIHLYREFSINIRDVASFERDPVALDLRPVAEAAMWCARKEDDLLFNGTSSIPGLLKMKGPGRMKLSSWDETGSAASDVINGITQLDAGGFHGPYVLALSPARFNLLYRRYPQGPMTEMEHIQSMATKGVVKIPSLKSGGILLSEGSHFASIVLGQDMTVGFVGPADGKIDLSISESLALQVMVPQSILILEG